MEKNRPDTYRLPAGYSFFQSISRTLKQVRDPIGTMQESMECFDGTYSVHLGRKRFIVTQDPAFIEYVLKTNHKNYHKSEIQTEALGRFIGKGLLTSNGEFWLRQRRLIQPGFHQERIRSLYQIMERTVWNFLRGFPEGTVDVYPLMNGLAFDIVMNTLFDVNISDASRRELSDFIFNTQDFIIRDLRQPYKSWWFRLSGEMKHHLDNAQRARQMIRDIITKRKASGERHGDLLDMLLEARYEDSGEAMGEETLIDEILVLIIAGHETTANALSWMLYLLAGNQDVLKKLISITNDLSTTEAVSNDFLNAVINETMRLYPPAYISDRVALKDDHFGEFVYPANTIIILFYYGLHRDGKLWDDADTFRPERFLRDAGKGKTKIFFPFGYGPRLCIGNSFALAEMAIFIRYFIHRFSISPSPINPQVNALVTLKPDKVILEIQRRELSFHKKSEL